MSQKVQQQMLAEFNKSVYLQHPFQAAKRRNEK